MHYCRQRMSWIEGTITMRREWAEGLMTLGLDAEIEPYAAGQFVNLGLDIGGTLVRRSYSIASPPGGPLEFYLNLVEGGVLTPRLFELPLGAGVQVQKTPQGFFTLGYVPPARELWMVATGTGLGPFMAMLGTKEPWQRFERIVVVHGVRIAAHLAYASELADLSRAHGGRLVRVPAVTRQPDAEGVLHGRITELLERGEIERTAGLTLSPERSHLMLCGNPGMIADTIELLKGRGLRKHRVRNPGHISIEKYW